MGKSSGGFGALAASMLRPDVFGACASHAGDAFYEVLYRPHMREVVRSLRSWDGDIQAWWTDFQARCPDVLPSDRRLEYVLGVAACFSPDAQGIPVLPVDTRDALHFDIIAGADHDAISRRRVHLPLLAGWKALRDQPVTHRVRARRPQSVHNTPDHRTSAPAFLTRPSLVLPNVHGEHCGRNPESSGKAGQAGGALR